LIIEILFETAKAKIILSIERSHQVFVLCLAVIVTLPEIMIDDNKP
jgi:hypothetical protein